MRDEWDELIATNLTGTFFLTQQIGRHLIERQASGRIITIASVHALVGAPERSAYGNSKAALLQMTRMLAIEWAKHGITVNAVAPSGLRYPVTVAGSARLQQGLYRCDAQARSVASPRYGLRKLRARWPS